MGFSARWGRSRQQVYDEMVEQERQLARDPRERRAQAVQLLVAVAVLVVSLVLVGTVSWTKERPLRADGLPVTSAEVLERDRRRAPRSDVVVVRWTPAGAAALTSEIPTSELYRPGEQVQVAYDPADPEHVRLVQGWEPWHASGELGFGLLVGLVGLVLGAGRLVVATLQMRRGVTPAG